MTAGVCSICRDLSKRSNVTAGNKLYILAWVRLEMFCQLTEEQRCSGRRTYSDSQQAAAVLPGLRSFAPDRVAACEGASSVTSDDRGQQREISTRFTHQTDRQTDKQTAKQAG